MSSVRIELTGDGSKTLYSENFQAHYHSMHGALNESMHVFIKHGLRYYLQNHKPDRIRILEYGMGTGLNVILSLRESIEKNIDISYHTIEAHPIKLETAVALDYSKEIGYPDQFHLIHSCPWNKMQLLSPSFELLKIHGQFEEYQSTEQFDLIYFDAFAPNTQANLWEEEFLHKVVQQMSPKSILTSFCAQGAFKRSLKNCGLVVERLPGPPGKREMTRAFNR